MLRVVESDRIERLLDVLVERVGARHDPFERIVIATPTRVVERKAETAIALALGIAGGLEHVRLAPWIERTVNDATGRRVVGGAALEGLLRDVLLDEATLAAPSLAAARAYVQGVQAGGVDAAGRALRERRACELAARLAHLYAGYAQDRFELVRSWLRGEPGEGTLAAWQGELLRVALARAGQGVASIVEAPEVLAQAGLGGASGEVPLVVLGYSYLSRLEHACVRALALRGEVLLLAPSPCAEFWEDATPRAAREGAELESALLAAWGTASREHLAALDEASGYTADRLFDAPADAAEASALGRLQGSIRERRPVRAPAAGQAETDDTLVRIAAPALRREVEAVAAEIWAIVHAGAREGGEPVRFSDIAVWLPARDRDLYLPHVETVFAEAHDIPWSGVDLALASRSRAVEAAVRLVGLVGGGPTRAALLDVVTHPLVLASIADAPEPDALAATLDRLAVFFGASEADLPAPYGTGPRAVDVGQAIERLALGAVMLGEASGQTRSFVRGAQRWLPEEQEGAAELVLLLRSLVADVQEARRAQRTVAEWGSFFAALVEAYVIAEGFEEAELARAITALAHLDAAPRAGGARATLAGPTSGAPTSGAPTLGVSAACELAMRALESLPAVRGETERGVLVGVLSPHRASSHRVAFVLGLGEGRFPSRASDPGLDLRAGDRRRGEVTPEDRDRLALLEVVVAVRDRLVLSWVARDEQTGDEIAPAHALAELVHAVGAIETRTPLLRRDREALELTRLGEDPARAPSARASALVRAAALPLAAEEARARVLGDEERATWAQSATPLRDLAMGLAETDARRSLLALSVVPPAASVLRGPIRVSLAELRASLDCAVQAAGKRLVGVAVDDGELADVDAEPFELGLSAHDQIVRHLVLALLGAGGAAAALDDARVDALLEAEVERRVAHGQFPLGVFGVRARRRAADTAREVMEELARVRPGRTALRTTRFGAGREHGDDASEARDPIRVGEALGRGEARPIEIVGTTQPMLGGEELLRLDLGPPRAGERRTVAELRHALHAFVDHAALAAASTAPGKARRGLVVSPRGSLDIQLAPVRPDVARRWLAKLARDVALEPQTSFLPIEAVLRVAHLFRTGSPDVEAALATSIEHVRTKWEGGRSRYGPIRDATRLPAPAAPARVVGERFAIFFTHLVRPPIEAPVRRKKR